MTGSVRAEDPGATWEGVADALVTEYALEYDVAEDTVDRETLTLARELVAEHRVQ